MSLIQHRHWQRLALAGLAAMAAVSAATIRPAQAAAVLNSITAHAGDGGVGSTNNGAFYTLDIVQAPASSSISSYLNNAHVSNLNISMTPGSYTFSGFWADGSTPGSSTVNFWFDGSVSSNLQATAAYTNSLASIPSFSGTLSHDNGTQTVTISSFIALSGSLIASLGIPSVHPSGSYGSFVENQSGFQVTFTVTSDTPVPEPSSMALLAGVAGLALIRKRKAPSTNWSEPAKHPKLSAKS
ncbi:MAG: PEP-CTERM sorting domain-containing protein [Rhodospirillales bacterium]